MKPWLQVLVTLLLTFFPSAHAFGWDDVSTEHREWVILGAINRTPPSELAKIVDDETANAIRAFRFGPDKTQNTSDDRQFQSPDQLAEVASLSTSTSQTIYDLALEKWGQPSDPFSPNSCVGKPLLAADTLSWIPIPDANEVTLGEFQGHYRRRYCYAKGPCRAWESVSDKQAVKYAELVYSSSRLENVNVKDKTFAMPTLSGEFILELRNDEPRFVLQTKHGETWLYNFSSLAAESREREMTLYVSSAEPATARGSSHHYALSPPGIKYLAFSERTITASCGRYFARWKDNHYDDKHNEVFWEYEMALVGSVTPPCSK